MIFDDAENDIWATAENVPNDPEPQQWEGGEPKKEAPIRITKAVKADIEGKVAFMLTMTATAWSLNDPFCANVLLENTPGIAEKLVPVICQSQDAVRWFRKTSGAVLYVDLLIAVMPVIQAIYTHHIASNMNGKMPQQDMHVPDFSQEYTVR